MQTIPVAQDQRTVLAGKAHEELAERCPEYSQIEIRRMAGVGCLGM
jgi:hypothetical protein